MEKFVFVHIHKTGGMSLFSALSETLGKDACLRFANGGTRDTLEFESLSQERISNLRLISGHFFYPSLLRKITPEWTPIVIVRDPLARLISAYNYMSQSFHELSNELAHMSFEEYYNFIMQKGDSEQNIQCKYICGHPSFERTYDTLKKNKFIFSSLDNLPVLFNTVSERIGYKIACREINISKKRTESSNGNIVSPELYKRILNENMDDYKLYWLINRLSSSGISSI